jgi:MerR family redox-sensitive transcriptional activator SoxR
MLTIGEVAKRAGLNTSAIRYYERKGLLPKPERISGQRRYDESILQQLSVIRLAQQAGFTIAEIRALFNEFPLDALPSVRWQTLATGKIAEIDALIQRAIAMKAMLEQLTMCQCESLDVCGGQV